MKLSQQYPRAFGQHVAAYHMEYKESETRLEIYHLKKKTFTLFSLLYD